MFICKSHLIIFIFRVRGKNKVKHLVCGNYIINGDLLSNKYLYRTSICPPWRHVGSLKGRKMWLMPSRNLLLSCEDVHPIGYNIKYCKRKTSTIKTQKRRDFFQFCLEKFHGRVLGARQAELVWKGFSTYMQYFWTKLRDGEAQNESGGRKLSCQEEWMNRSRANEVQSSSWDQIM